MIPLQLHQLDPGSVADGDYSLTVESGVVTGLSPASPGGGSGSGSSVGWMPLTTDIGGVPELVWGADNSLIPTEVPL